MRQWKTCFVAALCLAAIGGCGSSSSSSSTSSSSAGSSGTSSTATPAANATIAAEVPAAIKSKGTLTVAADATYAPNEFFAPDGKTVIGMDVDLVKALGGLMGLKVNVQNAKFDAIIPGLAGNKYDLGASSFTDTKDREKTVDFVTYFSAGESFYTKAQGGVSVNTLADLCGHTVAVETATTEKDDATKQSAKCTKAGKKAVTVLVFPDQNAANLALSSGRAQIGFADSPVVAYAVKKTNGQFKLVGQTFGTAPYGLALPKGNGMAKPVLDAVKALMADGQYKAILTRWGVQDGAITNPVINGATS
jgi:polar amino acid transport system substrate-binding protein